MAFFTFKIKLALGNDLPYTLLTDLNNGDHLMKIGLLATSFNAKLDHKSHADRDVVDFKINDQPDNFFNSGKVIAWIKVRTEPGDGINGSDVWPWIMSNDYGEIKIFPGSY